jgi:hypothetical protein
MYVYGGHECPPFFLISYIEMMRLKYFYFLLFAGLLSCPFAHAQKLLVLLKGEKVLLRLYPGDDITYKVKGSNRKKTSYVNNLSDTAVVTHNDTIPYYRIERLYFRRTTRANVIGTALTFGGAMLFLIDQLNYTAIQGNEFSLDRGVSTASIASMAAGLPMMLIKKKSQRIRFPYKLMMARKGSIFYLPDPKGFTSPYLEN